jgi:hypothetical protein
VESREDEGFEGLTDSLFPCLVLDPGETDQWSDDDLEGGLVQFLITQLDFCRADH